MTRKEYIKRAEKARANGIAKRWIPRSEGKYSNVECKFCDLYYDMHSETFCMDVCMIHNGEYGGCCALWDTWVELTHGEETPITKEAKQVASKMIAYLESLDIPKWADHLVELGFLKP